MNTSQMVTHPARNPGYSHDDGGFSGSFSWWRADRYEPVPHGIWRVMPHEHEFSTEPCHAVMDDFGNLRRIKQ